MQLRDGQPYWPPARLLSRSTAAGSRRRAVSRSCPDRTTRPPHLPTGRRLGWKTGTVRPDQAPATHPPRQRKQYPRRGAWSTRRHAEPPRPRMFRLSSRTRRHPHTRAERTAIPASGRRRPTRTRRLAVRTPARVAATAEDESETIKVGPPLCRREAGARPGDDRGHEPSRKEHQRALAVNDKSTHGSGPGTRAYGTCV